MTTGRGRGIGGLSPSTTYHYRLVATDSAGFTTSGTDIGFTTPAAPPPAAAAVARRRP